MRYSKALRVARRLERTRVGRALFLGLGAGLAFGCTKAAHKAADRAPDASSAQRAELRAEKDAAADAARELQQRGQALYARTCAVCHGPQGEGYKADRAPALAHPSFLASVDDAFLREAITHGRNNSTMSAWSKQHGGPLSSEDIEAVIAFIRSFEQGARMTLDEHPLYGDAKRAAPVYKRLCARCHGERGVGGPDLQIGNPRLLKTASNGFLRFAIWAGRPGTDMNAFGGTLSTQEIEDMVALVRSFGGKEAELSVTSTEPPPRLTAPLPLGKVPLHPKGPAPRGFKTYPSTTPAQVIHRELARGARMALLDARAPSDFVRQHIAGAVSVPFYDPSPYLDKLPKDAWLVTYCACPSAESGELAQKLLNHGFKNVTVLAEGIGHWISQGWKTEGAEPAPNAEPAVHHPSDGH